MKFLGMLSVGLVCVSSLEAMLLSQQEEKGNDAQLHSADVMRRSTSGSSGEDEQGSGQEQKEKENLEEPKLLTEEELDKLEKIFSDEIPEKIKFLNNANEKKRVTQSVLAITEQFYSDQLGFSKNVGGVFFYDSPIQEFEGVCAVYDISELAQLKDVQNLKSILREQAKDSCSYPNICELLKQLEEQK